MGSTVTANGEEQGQGTRRAREEGGSRKVDLVTSHVTDGCLMKIFTVPSIPLTRRPPCRIIPILAPPSNLTTGLLHRDFSDQPQFPAFPLPDVLSVRES